MPAGVVIAEAPSGKIIFVNSRAQEWTEQSPSQTRRTKLEDAGDCEIFHPAGRPYEFEEWPLMRSIRDGEEVRDEEFIYPLADGTGLLLRCDSSPIYDDEGRIVAGVLLAHDITEQKWAEKKLERSEERFRLLVEGVRDYAIFMLDTEGHIQSWNGGARRIKGYSQQEILGQHFSIFYPPEDVELGKPERELREAEAKGIYEEEGWRVRKDGSPFWARVLITALRDEAGQLRGFAKVTRDITERKLAEEALHESSRRIENILDSIDEFSSVDRKWRYTYINERALRRIQRAKGEALTREEVMGKNIWELYPELVGTTLYQELHRALRGQQTIHLEGYSPLSDRWVEVHAYPFEEGLAMYSRDVTERKRAEEQLVYQARRLLENVHDAVIATDERLFVTAWNKGAEQMYGWRADEVLGRNLWEVIPTELSKEQRAEALRELAGTGRLRTEAITHAKDGTLVWVEGITIALRGGEQGEGEITGYLNIRRDISERKQAETELLALKDELNAELSAMTRLHELSTRLLATSELQPLLEEVLDASIQLQGADFGNIQLYNPETGKLDIVVHRGFDQEFLDYFRDTGENAACGRAMKQGKRVLIEDVEKDAEFEPHRQIAASAGYRAVQSTPLFDRKGEPLGVLSTHFRQPHRPSERELRMTDLYARQAAEMIVAKLAEESLRRSEEALRYQSGLTETITDKAADPMLMLDAQGHVTFANPAAEQMFGWSREELLGEVLHDKLHHHYPDGQPYPESGCPIMAALAAQNTLRDHEDVFFRKDGSAVDVSCSYVPLVVAGEVTGAVLVVRDISDRKRAEQRLEEVREDERSRIARDIHDDALQDLSGALVEAQRLRSASRESPPLQRTERLIAALDRVGQQLRAAVYDLRLGGEQDGPFAELLESRVELQRTMAPALDIHLEVQDGVLSGPLEKTGTELLRIIGEALTNARRHSEARNIWVTAGTSEGKLWAEVKDDGRGFDAHKESTPTTTGGIGIRGMRERARMLGGELKTESEPQKGTKVRFELALGGGRQESRRKTRVLLVEDHAAVREAIAIAFNKDEGFEVAVQAASLSEAKEMLGAEPEVGPVVDVAVVDLGLPDGYGGDLIKELRAANPRAQALVLSAGLDSAEIARAVQAGAAGVLNKTAHLDEVVEAVGRLRAGETLMSLEEVVELLRYAGSRREEKQEWRRAVEKLTPREIEVLQALAEGLDSQGIAESLHISLRTERNHMANILSKLEVHSQLQALVFALRHGVVEIR
jgi:PAS domain S-box-containing protein